MEQTTDALAAVEELRSQLEAIELPEDLASVEAARRDRIELIDQIDDYLLPRLQRLDAPLLVVLGGSTGAGKSTITNSLVGTEVTKAGVLRPTTRAPVLVCHPDDEDWFLADAGVLAGLPRSTSATAVGDVGLRVVTSSELPSGLAMLDAPDIDSIEIANHDLAAQLLGAADLWLFVTTAARYADAVPWDYLGLAHERSAALAVIINRIPSGSEEEVEHHFASMLAERGLAGTTIFSVTEGDLDDGRIGPGLEPVRTWLDELSRDAAERAKLVTTTLDGALASIPDRVDRIAQAADDHRDRVENLRRLAVRRYAQAVVDIDTELDRGTLLRGEVLDQWREFVGTGAFMSKLEAGVSRVRDTIRSVFKAGPSPDEQAAGQLESNLLVVSRDATDRAAEDVVAAWEGTPLGASLLADADRGIDRASKQLPARIEHELNAWEEYVLDLVREESGDKITIARTVSTGINGVGVALMIAVFSQTGGLAGGEAAIAGGTAAVSQAVLTAIFGDQAVRDLARKAREDLISRLERLLAEDRVRFDVLLGDAETSGESIRLAAQALQDARG